MQNNLGLTGLIISALGLFICLLSLPGLIISLIALRREPKTLAIIGTVLGVLGLFTTPFWIALLLPTISNTRESAKTQTAQSYMNLLKIESDHHQKTNKAWPKSIDDLDSKEVIIRKDPWGNDVRFEGNGMNPPTISSAGPDGVHDTADDITPKSSYR